MKFVKLLKRYMDAEDNVYEPDSVLEVSDDVAEELIKAERAEAHDGVVKEVKPEDIKGQISEEIKNAVADAMKTKEDDGAEVEGKKIEVVEDAPLWKSGEEFLKAVMHAGTTGRVDERLWKGSGEGQEEADNAEGGYLVERRLTSTIEQMTAQASVLAAKCSVLEVGPNANGVKIPQVDESTRSATTLFGGVRLYAPAEGAAKTAFTQSYTQEDVALGKLAAVNYVTDELLADRVGYADFMARNVANAFAWHVDNEILNGTLSVMAPIVGDGATQAVTVAGDHPTRDEWMEMYRSMVPSSRQRAEWYMSNDQFSMLPSLEDDGSNAIYQPDMRVSPHGTLLGRPVNVIEQAGAAATAASILFADLSKYLIIKRGGLKQDTSIHVKFLEDETCFRWVLRIGGAPLIASTVTLPDSSVIAPFVTRNTD